MSYIRSIRYLDGSYCEIVGNDGVTSISEYTEYGHMAEIRVYGIFKKDAKGQEYQSGKIYPNGHYIEYLNPPTDD